MTRAHVVHTLALSCNCCDTGRAFVGYIMWLIYSLACTLFSSTIRLCTFVRLSMASFSIRETRSAHVGMSLIRPTTCPAVHTCR